MNIALFVILIVVVVLAAMILIVLPEIVSPEMLPTYHGFGNSINTILQDIYLVHGFNFSGFDNIISGDRFIRNELFKIQTSVDLLMGVKLMDRYINYTDFMDKDMEKIYAPPFNIAYKSGTNHPGYYSFRGYMHCSWNTLVYSHKLSWENRDAVIVTPLLAQKGRIFRLNPCDTMILDYLTITDKTFFVCREEYKDKLPGVRVITYSGNNLRYMIDEELKSKIRVLDSPINIENMTYISILNDYINNNPTSIDIKQIFYTQRCFESYYSLPIHARCIFTSAEISSYTDRIRKFCGVLPTYKSDNLADARHRINSMLNGSIKLDLLDEAREAIKNQTWNSSKIHQLINDSSIMVDARSIMNVMLSDRFNQYWEAKINRFITKKHTVWPELYYESNLLKYKGRIFSFQREYQDDIQINPDIFSGRHSVCDLNNPPYYVEIDALQNAFTFACGSGATDIGSRFSMFEHIFKNEQFDNSESRKNFNWLIKMERKSLVDNECALLGLIIHPLIIIAYMQYQITRYLEDRPGFMKIPTRAFYKTWELVKKYQYYMWIMAMLFPYNTIRLSHVPLFDKIFPQWYEMYEKIIDYYCNEKIDFCSGVVNDIACKYYAMNINGNPSSHPEYQFKKNVEY